MKNIEDKKVGDLVVSNYKYADVFMKYGIDFCCGGGVSLRNSCDKNQVNLDEVVSELNRIESEPLVQNESKMTLDELIDHIESKHHAYVRESLPILRSYSDKVAKVHGAKYNELLEIRGLLNDLENDLMPHLNKEEVILFPYIRQMLGDSSLLTLPINSVRNPIEVMLHEHDTAGDILKHIKVLTNSYRLPEDACTTFIAFYRLLEEFEKDLYRHIHLENNILFPKAIELENS
ncbi:iron-sulfur cluster repair di-iron protein [Fulvivirga lutimaris]|uniref:iron-sulfur cluster repair di-iron protein n=1 Tax=Fulvivirga lutimaris TaxID=1819566 RepID=UPI0012BB8BA5|nr:iron-sulfur cluster repair di-iron protein [Fulvivirga lutimaris]MTI40448.1 iron-sulfur cluster repair di-iron protein [Fulvivirga lutimaris]